MCNTHMDLGLENNLLWPEIHGLSDEAESDNCCIFDFFCLFSPLFSLLVSCSSPSVSCSAPPSAELKKLCGFLSCVVPDSVVMSGCTAGHKHRGCCWLWLFSLKHEKAVFLFGKGCSATMWVKGAVVLCREIVIFPKLDLQAVLTNNSYKVCFPCLFLYTAATRASTPTFFFSPLLYLHFVVVGVARLLNI